MNLENLKIAMLINKYAVEPHWSLKPDAWNLHHQIRDLKKSGLSFDDISEKLGISKYAIRNKMVSLRYWEESGCDQTCSRIIGQSKAWKWGLTSSAQRLLEDMGVQDHDGLESFKTDFPNFELYGKFKDEYAILRGTQKDISEPLGTKHRVSRALFNEIRLWMRMEPILKPKRISPAAAQGAKEVKVVMRALASLDSRSPAIQTELSTKLAALNAQVRERERQRNSFNTSQYLDIRDPYALQCLMFIAD